jgi:hypothetical protein
MKKEPRYFEKDCGFAVHKENKKITGQLPSETGVIPKCNQNIILYETYPAQAAFHWKNVTCKNCLRSK